MACGVGLAGGSRPPDGGRVARGCARCNLAIVRRPGEDLGSIPSSNGGRRGGHRRGSGVLCAFALGDVVDKEGIDTDDRARRRARSEEHTSELQSLMRISYAVFCLKKKKQKEIKKYIISRPQHQPTLNTIRQTTTQKNQQRT